MEMLASRSSSWHSAMSTPRASTPLATNWRQRLASCGKFKKTPISDYDCTGRCGVGSYSQVVKAVQKSTGKTVALKMFRPWSPYDNVSEVRGEVAAPPQGRTPPSYRDLVDTLVKEAEFIGRCRGHPNVVKVLAICIDNPTFALERASYDLFTVVKKHHADLPTEALWFWAKQIASGLEAIHQAGMIHLDVKSSNVLLMSDLTAKVCDFGNTSDCSQGKAVIDKEVITLWYRPTDILMGAEKMCPKADTWSFGCVLLEMLIGTPAFKGDDKLKAGMPNVNYNDDQLDKIFRICGTPDMQEFRHYRLHRLFSRRVQKHQRVLERIIQTALDKKARVSKANNNGKAWISLISSLLDFHPETRMSSADAAKR
eukprot:CAMPEP_0172006608 /NCGR_PEP_ID=MMETSP1041-20130122/5652_1 /TAXON_ID=464988 /ORGANISM="Hemiselmis andersenii, Strain CCMP439" /LENGTH=368 /DNA_ID=CAMNT_0012660643 /DNA_START=148 /DNA_END=1250 /DNA_ORIENTATION=+